MIETRNIKKIYTTGEVITTALENVNLNVKKGEFVAIMGPSGCGKTTLLNIIGLIETPTSGQYLLDNKLVSDLAERNRTNIRKGNFSFVFQSFNLIDDLNVYENVELPLIALNISRNKRKNMVDEILEKMQVGHRKDHFPRQLSGGQQQRVAVARALITAPKLILADEPTGNLDSHNGEQVMQLLEQLNAEGTTIVMVTHSLNHAERAHRVVNLFDGQIITERVDRIFEPQLQ